MSRNFEKQFLFTCAQQTVSLIYNKLYLSVLSEHVCSVYEQFNFPGVYSNTKGCAYSDGILVKKRPEILENRAGFQV